MFLSGCATFLKEWNNSLEVNSPVNSNEDKHLINKTNGPRFQFLYINVSFTQLLKRQFYFIASKLFKSSDTTILRSQDMWHLLDHHDRKTFQPKLNFLVYKINVAFFQEAHITRWLMCLSMTMTGPRMTSRRMTRTMRSSTGRPRCSQPTPRHSWSMRGTPSG